MRKQYIYHIRKNIKKASQKIQSNIRQRVENRFLSYSITSR
jgi:hypothetical protein